MSAGQPRVLVVSPEDELAREISRAVEGRATVERVEHPAAISWRFETGLASLVLDSRGAPGGGALDRAIRSVRRNSPGTRIFVVIRGTAPPLGLREHAGYVSARSVPVIVSRALGDRPASADDDHRWLDDEVQRWARVHGLTEAETGVAAHAIRGLQNKEIGRTVGKGVATVRTHLLVACRKLGVTSRGELGFRFFSDLIEGTDPETGDKRYLKQPGRPLALVVSGDTTLRSLVLGTFDHATAIEAIVLRPDFARAQVRTGLTIQVCVIDSSSLPKTDAWLEGFVALVRHFNGRAAVLLMGSEPAGSREARRLGVSFLESPPFMPDRFVRAVQAALARSRGRR